MFPERGIIWVPSMPYSFRDIHIDWLLRNRSPVSSEHWEAAFNWCEATFGGAWLARSGGGRSIVDPYVVFAIYYAAQRGASVEGIDRLIRKIGTNVQSIDWSVLTEVQVAAHFASYGTVELEPAVQVGTRIRQPDLRVIGMGEPLYIEATQMEVGQHASELWKILKDLTEELDHVMGTHLELYLYREPSEMELVELRNAAKAAYQAGPGYELTLPHLAQICLSRSDEDRLNTLPAAINETRPILGMVSFAGQAGNPDAYYRASARLPFTDQRARAIIKKEAGQLPPNCCGLVVINLTGSVSGMKFWPKVARRLFSRSGHTRLSGVFMYTAHPAGSGHDLTKELVLNPHASHPLSEAVKEAIMAFADDWPHLQVSDATIAQ